MDQGDWLAQRFDEHHKHLKAVAQRILGSASEADDAIQETWLKLSRSDAGEVGNLGGWLTTVLARVCLVMLRTRRRNQRMPQEYSADSHSDESPGNGAVLADATGMALLVSCEAALSQRRNACY
jgi:DNA-directed RNA polymerase specialized sigma24 family protein